jgi:hypothetical protein
MAVYLPPSKLIITAFTDKDGQNSEIPCWAAKSNRELLDRGTILNKYLKILGFI